MDGVRRYATLEDLNNLQKLNHMASTIHIAGGTIVEPVDIRCRIGITHGL